MAREAWYHDVAMADFAESFPLPNGYDLRRTMWLSGLGYGDPARRYDGQQVLLGFHTPDGAVSVSANVHERELPVQCWGGGAEWITPKLQDLFGLHDDPTVFKPEGKLGKLLREVPGIHLPRLPLQFERLVQIVLQQLVSWADACRGWKMLVERFGVEAPGPNDLRMGPSPKVLQKLGYSDLVACGIMPKQARLILQLAKESKRIERLATSDRERFVAYLNSIRGVGEWTIQYLLGTGLGDPDAVMVGDYGLPNTVSWFFAEKPRSNDEEMLELLEPYRGHRFRVINALMQAGIRAPKFGPKMRTNRWRFTTK